ncbi:MAG: hypothetical protein ACE5R6_19735 [Candidatus Heimdallarchaeota archaeon]
MRTYHLCPPIVSNHIPSCATTGCISMSRVSDYIAPWAKTMAGVQWGLYNILMTGFT